MPTYTIKQVKPTGKADTGYGVPYFVQFEEDERAVYAQKKSEPQVGDQWDGDIVADKYNGLRFKKAPFVPGQASAQASTPAQASTYTKPAYKDNSDGQRQGMCINNAANFVNALATPDMSDAAWANMVHAYASALYALGDLTTEDKVVDVTGDEDVKTVLDAFAN